MKRHAVIDTETLERGLAAFLPPKDDGRRPSVNAALTLCNLIMMYDHVCYDEAIRKPTKDIIDECLNSLMQVGATKDHLDSLNEILAGIEIEGADARQAASEISLLESFGFLSQFQRNLEAIYQHVSAGQHDDVAKNEKRFRPSEHLFGILGHDSLPGEDIVGAIASDKKITGRRFYAAILTNENVYESLSRLKAEQKLSDVLMECLFTRFRMQLAENSAIYTANVNSCEAYYFPTPERVKFANSIGTAIRTRREPWTDTLEPTLWQIWRDEISDCCYGETVEYIPMALNPIIDKVVLKSPIDLLRASIEAREGDNIKKIRGAMASYSRDSFTPLKRSEFFKNVRSIAHELSMGRDPESGSDKRALTSILWNMDSPLAAVRAGYEYFCLTRHVLWGSATVLATLIVSQADQTEVQRKVATLFSKHVPNK